MNKLVAIGISVALASQALAQVQFDKYADDAAFRSALAGVSYTETFESLDLGAFESGNHLFQTGSLAFNTRADEGLLLAAYDAIDSTYLTTYETTGLRIEFTAGAPNAIGGLFLGTTDSDELVDTEFHIAFSDGSSFDIPFESSSEGSFWGFISSIKNPFEWMWIGTSDAGTYVGVDNLTVGYAAIPEPSTYGGALGLGALVLASFRRRRQR